MQYSERRLRIEYTITRLITFLLAVVAAISTKSWFEDLSTEYAGALSTAVFFLPGLYAFFKMRVVYAWAKCGHERSNVEA